MLLACAVLVSLNVLFLVVRLADFTIDKTVVADAIRTAFETGAFVDESYPRNRLQGFDQYSDCVTAEIAVIGGRSWLSDAVAPRMTSKEQVGTDLQPIRRSICGELRHYVDGTFGREPDATYTRFWHGAAGVFSAAMLVLPVDGYRALLLDGTLALIALCAVSAALQRRALLLALAPLLAVSFVVGGQVGYGQLISYGPAAIAAWSMALIAVRSSLDQRRLIGLATAAGALEAFLDQLISVPLAASIFIVVSGLVSVPRWLDQGLRPASLDITVGTGAWILGFVGTFAGKLALSVALLGQAPVSEFVEQLVFRTGTIDPELGLFADLQPSRLEAGGTAILWLGGQLWRLFYMGQSTYFVVAPLVALVALFGWIVAAVDLAKAVGQGRGKRVLIGYLPYLAASFFFLVWIVALPEHTVRHAFFMVRSAMIWLAGGWGCVFTARYLTDAPARSPMAPDSARR